MKTKKEIKEKDREKNLRKQRGALNLGEYDLNIIRELKKRRF